VWNVVFASTAISALGMVLARLLRHTRPLVRHRMLCGVLVAILSCPALLLVGQNELPFGAVHIAAKVELPARIQQAESSADQVTKQELSSAASDANQVAGKATWLNGIAGLRVDSFGLSEFTGAVILVWAIGTTFLLWRRLRAVSVCRRLKRSVRLSGDLRLLRLAAAACDAVQIDYCIPVGTSELTPGPVALGVCKPLIVLPDSMEKSLGDEELLCVLIHEAAHVGRHDMALTCAWQLSTCLYWWNPLVQLICGEIGQAREQICDDYVIRARGTGDTLAIVLVKLAEMCLEPRALARPIAAIPLLETDDLSQRITRLTEGASAMTVPLGRAKRMTMALLVCAITAGSIVPLLKATEKQTKKPAPTRLSYNDGKADGKKSIAGAAELLKFSAPESNAKVAAIRIHGSRYGYPQAPKEDFEILFLNPDLTEAFATKSFPYSRFKRGPESWVEIKLPMPLEVPKEFWVGLNFNAEQTKGVYVSYDSSTDGARSRVGLPGEDIRDAKVGGDWMIELVLEE
jgi:beta-lactamase regulating signal transducer with metallopeptidase domain